MAEAKILIPSYRRTGSCARCGEAVYSPALEHKGGWPLMSACGCEHGPQLAHQEKNENSGRQGEAAAAEQAKAA
jgi:hypothetical protein